MGNDFDSINPYQKLRKINLKQKYSNKNNSSSNKKSILNSNNGKIVTDIIRNTKSKITLKQVKKNKNYICNVNTKKKKSDTNNIKHLTKSAPKATNKITSLNKTIYNCKNKTTNILSPPKNKTIKKDLPGISSIPTNIQSIPASKTNKTDYKYTPPNFLNLYKQSQIQKYKNNLTLYVSSIPSSLSTRLNNSRKHSNSTISNSSTKKPLAIFLCLYFFFVFTIKSLANINENYLQTKNNILSNTNVAYQYLNSAEESILSKDFNLASYKFKIASERFHDSHNEVNQITSGFSDVIKDLPVNNKVTSGANLISVGSNLSLCGEHLSKAMAPFSSARGIIGDKALGGNENPNSDEKISLTNALITSNEEIKEAKKYIALSEQDLTNVDPSSLPEDIAPQIEMLKDIVPKLHNSINYYLSYSDLILELLGANKHKKYLVLFQNNREIRPTGGFIGTYGLFDMNEGTISNIKIEGPYNIDGQIDELIIAPEPIRLIQNKFYLRDANWFADFPTSASKISDLYEKSGGPSVDGVIAITANMMQDLLEITGPIKLPEYDVTIDKDNFYDATQNEVENEYDKELNRPKKFISDLFPILMNKLLDSDQDNWFKIIDITLSKLDQKDILFYFQNQELQQTVTDFGFGGELKNTSSDYLYIVNSNIGGGKTDHIIDQNNELNTEILPDGSIVNTLKITRTHNGDINDPWTSIKNVDYMRIYVPKGSELIEAKGFDPEFYKVLFPIDEGTKPDPTLAKIEESTIIDKKSKTRISEETDKTVFGNWIGIETGQSKNVFIKYKLPFKVNLTTENPVNSYSLFVQKQPGDNHFTYDISLRYPPTWSNLWTYSSDNNALVNGNIINYNTQLNKDKLYATILNR